MRIIVSFSYTHFANEVGDGIARFDPTTTLGVDPQSHVDVRETFLIRVVLRIFCQGLERRKPVVKSRQESNNENKKEITASVEAEQKQLFPHLVDLVLVQWYGSTSYLLSQLHQVFLDVLHNDIATLI